MRRPARQEVVVALELRGRAPDGPAVVELDDHVEWPALRALPRPRRPRRSRPGARSRSARPRPARPSQMRAQEVVRRAPAREAQVAGRERHPRLRGRARGRREHGFRGSAQPGRASATRLRQRERPARRRARRGAPGAARLAARGARAAGLATSAQAPARGRRRARPPARSSSQTRGGDHVAHRHASAVAAVELEALDQSGVGQALEPSLRGRRRAPRVEPAMQLAASARASSGDQRRASRDRAGRARAMRGDSTAPGPAHAVRAVELDELAEALRWTSAAGSASDRPCRGGAMTVLIASGRRRRLARTLSAGR